MLFFLFYNFIEDLGWKRFRWQCQGLSIWGESGLWNQSITFLYIFDTAVLSMRFDYASKSNPNILLFCCFRLLLFNISSPDSETRQCIMTNMRWNLAAFCVQISACFIYKWERVKLNLRWKLTGCSHVDCRMTEIENQGGK